MKSFCIIGLGRFGSAVATTLAKQGMEVLAIDRNMERVEDHRSLLTEVIRADAMEKSVLEQIGASNFETAIVTIGGDVTASGTVTMLLKDMGVKNVIVKAYDDFHGRMLTKLGADKIVYPERDMGLQLAKRLCAKSVMEYISLFNDVDITELRVPERYVGQEVRSCGIRRDYGVNIIALRSGETTVTSIQPDYRFSPEDVLVLIGGSADMQRFTKAMQK